MCGRADMQSNYADVQVIFSVRLAHMVLCTVYFHSWWCIEFVYKIKKKNNKKTKNKKKKKKKKTRLRSVKHERMNTNA